jgi:hypothetical protein
LWDSLGKSFSPSTLISMIRAKEVAQAKIAEASERAAIREAQKKLDMAQEASKMETTYLAAPPNSTSQAGCRDEELEDLEAITVASLNKGKKKKAPKVLLPPRTNLRSTPARQARALNLVQQ